MTKYVYLFKEGNASMRNLLGGKGANLAEMTKIGLPVPQGFTVSTELAPATMRTARPSARISSSRFTPLWPRPRRSAARSSATWRIRSWFPCAPARARPCPA